MAPKRKTNPVLVWFQRRRLTIASTTKRIGTRANAAHFMMFCFVLFNSIGAWMIEPQYGLITAGICAGIYGYLLGSE